MLSLARLSSAQHAGRYFFERHDYYANGQAEPAYSTWRGRGAAVLDLTGRVTREALEKVLEGRLPNGQALGRLDASGKWMRAPGVDATFSAPKSVSILSEILDRDDIRNAHRKAVFAALDYAERNVLETRVYDRETKRQIQLGGQKAVIAVFEHNTSRAEEPALHHHSIIVSALFDENGKARSLDGKSLFENKMALGMIYRAELVGNLRNLGFDIERTGRDGRFEIKGVPKELIREFSTRRAEIETALEARGEAGPEAAAKAAIMTRTSKGAHDKSELKAHWGERAHAIGHDVARVAQQAQTTFKGRCSDRAAKEAVRSAVDHLSERSAAFFERDLVRQALNFGLGRARLSSILGAIENEKSKGRLLTAEEHAYRGMITTQAALELEQSTLKLARDGRGKTTPILPKSVARDALNRTELGEGQRAAVELALTSEDQFVAINGLAGTGKTTMVREVANLVREKGLKVIQ